MSETHTLKNGVRIVVDPMPSLETAALGVWAHAGSVDERVEEHGIAHLLEHMAFKGTVRRTAREIAEEIESVGGYLNAATSHQRTGYYARVLKDDVPLAIDLLGDILRHPQFSNAELAKEQEVVVQEIGEAADTPDDVVFELLQEATWDGHSLARPILGTPQSVRAQTPASLREFMARQYHPGALIVAAAGKIDAEQIIALAEAQFGDMTPASADVSRSVPSFVGGQRHYARDIEQTHFALAFPGVSARHEDFFATRVFADALGGGMSSRLFQTIREERGLAYSVYAFADGYEECGLVGTYVGAEAGQVVEAAKLIQREIEAMAHDVTQTEVDRARALLRASLMMSLESPAARIEANAGQVFTFGKTMAPHELVARLDAVTLDDIKRCACRSLEGPRSIAIVGDGEPELVEQVFTL
ncbi:MAG: pitrilysin family protein [Pseudomonadota bacterium]